MSEQLPLGIDSASKAKIQERAALDQIERLRGIARGEDSQALGPHTPGPAHTTTSGAVGERAPHHFDGATYEPLHDQKRLNNQLTKVQRLMLDGKWRSLVEIGAVQVVRTPIEALRAIGALA